MNEPDFESSLRELAPTPPSSRLAARIAAELATVPKPASACGVVERPARQSSRGLQSWLRSLGWAIAGAAAAVAVLGALDSTPAAPKPVAAASQPAPSVAATNVPAADPDEISLESEPSETGEHIVSTIDEGVVYDGGTPQRQVRVNYIEYATWTNPRTGAVIEMELPRQDVVLMPVAMQ